MGFPSGYPKDFIPLILIHILSLMGLIRSMIITLLRVMGLSYLLEPDFSQPEFRFIQHLLPVIKFSEVGFGDGSGPDPPEKCVVCLNEFEEDEEIRRLMNCGHIFHKGCVDRWMEHDQRTCPLCRALFVPDYMVERFNEKMWAPHIGPELGHVFGPINSFL